MQAWQAQKMPATSLDFLPSKMFPFSSRNTKAYKWVFLTPRQGDKSSSTHTHTKGHPAYRRKDAARQPAMHTALWCSSGKDHQCMTSLLSEAHSLLTGQVAGDLINCFQEVFSVAWPNLLMLKCFFPLSICLCHWSSSVVCLGRCLLAGARWLLVYLLDHITRKGSISISIGLNFSEMSSRISFYFLLQMSSHAGWKQRLTAPSLLLYNATFMLISLPGSLCDILWYRTSSGITQTCLDLHSITLPCAPCKREKINAVGAFVISSWN